MNLESVKQFIEENKDNEEVSEYLSGFKVDKDPSLEAFKSKAETDEEFKSFLDSIKDKHSSKALETWKANNLDSLIDNEIKTRFPEKDERDLAVQDLERKIQTMEKEKNHERLMNVALKKSTELGLPTDLVDLLVSADEETTLANIERFHESTSQSMEAKLKEKLQGQGDPIPNGGKLKTSSIGARLAEENAKINKESREKQDHYFK